MKKGTKTTTEQQEWLRKLQNEKGLMLVKKKSAEQRSYRFIEPNTLKFHLCEVNLADKTFVDLTV